MAKANQLKGEENAQILREYIDNNTSFPIHRGRLNKSKLLEDLGIPSARQRKDCAELLNKLDVEIAAKRAQKETDPDMPDVGDDSNIEVIKRLRNYINALHQKLALKEAQLDEYRRNDASETLLAKTGKILPRPFNPSQESLDLNDEKE